MYVSIVLAFVISVVLEPLVILFCKKKSVYDSTNDRKIHSGNIPRLGSVGFMTAFCLASVCYFLIDKDISCVRFVPVIIGGMVIFLFGFIDDVKELDGKIKLLFQSIAAFITIFTGFRFTHVGPVGLGYFSYVLTYCWIIGMVNSFNLIDGHDGLCGGLSFLIALGIAACTGRKSPAVVAECLILAASLLGFLVYNKPKAKIFMGDGGSQTLGYLIAVIPLYTADNAFHSTKFWGIILLCSIPLLDTVAAMWRRIREHRSFFSPDRAHLHHKLMNLGFGPWPLLIFLYSIQIGIDAAVFACSRTCGWISFVIYFAAVIFILAFYCSIHYMNRAVLRRKHLDFNGKPVGDILDVM